MMNYIMRICLILYCLISLTYADDSLLVKQATAFYKGNQFDQALPLYMSLHAKFPNNIGIMYNLGNTHFKLNQHGYALGYYLKALQWVPSNPDILYNISLARSLVQYDTNRESSILYTFLGWLRFLSINASFNIMMVFLLAFLLVLRLLQLKKFNREFLSNLLLIFGLFFVISISVFSYRYAHYSQDKGVVTSKKQAVYSGPSETLSILFYIHEGYEFSIHSITGDWVEIELSNGFKGWAPIAGLFII